jgi:BirA family biotin operon repressor/biotin-[acetyl-CoA-carboxylase] ligase
MFATPYICGKNSILFHNSSFSFAQHHLHLSEVASTNDLARKLAQENLMNHGYIITTDFQSQGRGQENNGWESEKGKNILCSILLNTQLSVEYQIYLNLTVSLAVYDFICKLAAANTVNIKWPNDVYLNNQKVAGVLIENSIQGMVIKQSIIGIGVNINQSVFTSLKATSLHLVTGEIYSIQSCMAEFLASFEYRYNQLLTGQFKVLWDDYHQGFYRKNMNTAFKAANQWFEGIPLGIDQAGRIVVKVKNEEVKFNVKEIVWL